MRVIHVSNEFPLNRQMRKAVRRGKLQVVRMRDELSPMGGGIPHEMRRAFRTSGASAVCMANNGAQVSEAGGKNNKTPMERAAQNRIIAKRVFRDMAKGRQRVGRNEWVDKTKAEVSKVDASCTRDMAYSAVNYLIREDPQVASEPKKDGSKFCVYFYRQQGNNTLPPPRKSAGKKAGPVRVEKESTNNAKGKWHKKSGEGVQKFLRRVALGILGELPSGEYIKISDWKADIMKRASGEISPDSNLNSAVHYATYYGVIKDGEVERGDDKGMYRLPQKESGGGEQEEPPVIDSSERGNSDDGEKQFYAPLAAYLRDVLLECDGAIDAGDLGLGGVWGTPDVIGVAKSSDNDLMPFTEMVSAEIKVRKSANWLMTGFGQACAYKNFSHQSYLVIPKGASSESRLISLCRHFGIGLVAFDEIQPPENRDPGDIFMLLNRARKDPPADMSQANKYLHKLRKGRSKGILTLKQWDELFRSD